MGYSQMKLLMSFLGTSPGTGLYFQAMPGGSFASSDVTRPLVVSFT